MHRLRYFCFVILTLGAGSSVAPHPLHGQSGPIGHWTFDGTLDDSAGTVHGWFSDGTPTYVAGVKGQAIHLDGIDDHVRLGTAADLNFGTTTDFTVALWVNTTGWSEDAAIVSNKNWNSGSNIGWVVAAQWGGTDSWQWNYRGASGGRVDYDPGGPALGDGLWHHLCVTHDRDGNAVFYFDGVLQDQRDISGSTGSIDAGLPTVVGTDGYEGQQWAYWFAGLIDDLRIYDRVLTEREVEALLGPPEPEGPRIIGPWVQFTGPFSGKVCWDTSWPCYSIVEYGPTDALGLRVSDAPLTTTHEIVLEDLELRTKYHFRVGYGIGAGERFSDTYTFDNAINYAQVDCSRRESPLGSHGPGASDALEAAARKIVEATGLRKGYCLVYGSGEGRLAFELARLTDMMIVGVDTDPASVRRSRDALMAAGVYGSRIKIRAVPTLDALPFPDLFFNLVVSERLVTEGRFPGSMAEVRRVLRPGGCAVLNAPGTERIPGAPSVTVNPKGGADTIFTQPAPVGTTEWPRLYGNPDNAACTGDTLGGATSTGQLQVQWIGWPGSDFGADRNPRMHAPVMAGGRLYHPGLDRVVAMDAYNGAIYWSVEIPGFMRVNMPRDGGHITADRDSLFLAVKDACLRLDGETGQRLWVSPPMIKGREWGYVAVDAERLYGSVQLVDAHYADFWGGAGWYDGTSGAGTAKVCSKELFAYDKAAGNRIWKYAGGVILNSTITLGGGRVCFVECRNAIIEDYPVGRIDDPLLWSDQFLVALDQATGVKQWEVPIDTVDGTVAFYMLYAGEKLFICSSGTRYYLYAFDATSGSPQWSANHAWTNNNHGGHMQHPVIAGDVIYLEPRGYDLDTGNLVTAAMGRHGGCATYAGGSGVMAYRGSSGDISLWDIDGGGVTRWDGVRPSCWLSTIIAGGMVLCPEGGGGCSCNGWINTSIGFMPERR